MISLERLAFVADGLFQGCVACPRPHEPGTLSVAADGNYALFRFVNADSGTQYRKSEHHNLYFPDYDIPQSLNDPMLENLGLCSTFTAADLYSSANRHKVKDEKGIFGLFCARHEVPLAFMDMFTGERYAYCDTLLANLFRTYGQDRKVDFFYDIACKYAVNFKVSIYY